MLPFSSGNLAAAKFMQVQYVVCKIAKCWLGQRLIYHILTSREDLPAGTFNRSNQIAAVQDLFTKNSKKVSVKNNSAKHSSLSSTPKVELPNVA